MAEYIEKETLLAKAKAIQGDEFSSPRIIKMIEDAPEAPVIEYEVLWKTEDEINDILKEVTEGILDITKCFKIDPLLHTALFEIIRKLHRDHTDGDKNLK